MNHVRPILAGALAATLACTFTFAQAAAPSESSLEAQLLNTTSAQGALASSKVIDQHYHYAGTAGDRALAVWMRDVLQRDGFTATIESFTYPVFTPKTLSLTLLTKPAVAFDLHEAPIASDPDGSRPDAGLPFNSGSGSGDIRRPVVYAGRGLPADYAALAAAGVAVRAKIVLVRYGAEFRGNLAHRAQDEGAAGVLFYNDPIDEGRGTPYPQGPNRPLGSTQRGSVGAELRIPTLPISALTAQRILRELHGAPAPKAFRGALDVAYQLGQTDVPAHMIVRMQKKQTTLWNTVGTIVGADPKQLVVLGGHRDAWVYGVTDNGSGISTLLEAARALGYLHRGGWQPRRSITIVGFDGEEIGEAGSQAYVAAHRAALDAGCVAYVNVDEVTTGQTFGGDAAAGIADDINAAAKTVKDPRDAGRSLYVRFMAQKDNTVTAPGGGSDFESFLYEGGGIPTIDIGFGGDFGVYHSAYDDIAWAQRFGDPGFVNHRAIAQMLAVLAIRFAQDEVLPYRLTPYIGAMQQALLTIMHTSPEAQRDAAPVQAAIARFSTAATAFDAHPDPSHNAGALYAVREINTLVYGRNGYAAVPFPKLLAAEQQGSAAEAAAQTAAAIDDASAHLK